MISAETEATMLNPTSLQAGLGSLLHMTGNPFVELNSILESPVDTI
jgi:hypothetical protein